MDSAGEKFASMLLDIKAVKLQPAEPFIWASGWHSPIYTDNRKTLAYPMIRSFVKTELLRLIREHFDNVTAIAGVATGAIAQGILVADELNLPYCYVRSKAKDHGTGNLIEGELPLESNVVVVEDLVSTGSSSLKAVGALRQAGFNVIGMVASYTYGFDIAERAFQQANVSLFTISDYTTTMQVAIEKGYITPADAKLLQCWRQSPSTWTQKQEHQ